MTAVDTAAAAASFSVDLEDGVKLCDLFDLGGLKGALFPRVEPPLVCKIIKPFPFPLFSRLFSSDSAISYISLPLETDLESLVEVVLNEGAGVLFEVVEDVGGGGGGGSFGLIGVETTFS